MRLHLLLVLLLGGCIEPQLVPCGDQLCAVGQSCIADHCATTEQVEACAGIADGEPCSVRGGTGICDSGVCLPVACGNTAVDSGEACDDGNTTGGDGCSADCRKIEMCGDGVSDEGEACDDGNSNAADGCDACIRTEWLASPLIGGSLPATSLGLTFPGGVAVDRSGNLYIADTDDNRILRVDTTGVVTTIAGIGGGPGFSGDGGQATSARLRSPSGITVDGLGNVFFVDYFRIRRIDARGIITTIAGNGTSGFVGDGGPATSARFTSPSKLAVDGLGNVYVNDNGSRIRRIDATGTITTIAGTGTPGATGDGGPATAATISVSGLTFHDGALYLAAGDRVRMIDAAGVITTIAGPQGTTSSGDGGQVANAGFEGAYAVTFDELGRWYILDSDRVREVDATGIITTLAGANGYGFAGDGGPATNAMFYFASDLAADAAGSLYIADQYNHRVRRIDTTRTVTTYAGMTSDGKRNDGGPATGGRLEWPQAFAYDSVGNLYIADLDDDHVRRVSPSGLISSFAGVGFNGSSSSAGDGGPAVLASLNRPSGVAVDSKDHVYITDSNNHAIRRVDTNGIITTIAGTGVPGDSGDGGPAIDAELDYPYGLAVDSADNLYVSVPSSHRVRRITPAGIISTVAGTGTPGFSGDGAAATSAQLDSPGGIAIDESDNLYIADSSNSRVRKVDLGGTITTFAGTGTSGHNGDGGLATAAQLGLPGSVETRGGYVYVEDSERVRRIDAGGIITTYAGTGGGGGGGDGGPATSATFSYLSGVGVDPAGQLLLADSNAGKVRRVDASGRMVTIAGQIDPDRMGVFSAAKLADPRALVVTTEMMLVAGGSSGTLQLGRNGRLEVAAGRYMQTQATSNLARFQSAAVGTYGGVAYDPAGQRVFVTETTTNKLYAITIVDPGDVTTWTIAPFANVAGTAGFADGAVGTARFRAPTGLYFDPTASDLYVADTGNHVIRAINIAGGLASATVRTVAGTPATRGMFGDTGVATTALLYAPEAITRCANGDLFVADTGNHRVRRIAAGTITTVLGVGVAASSGDGLPASTFPVNAPRGLACDAVGNLFVSSMTAVRLLPSNAQGTVDGTGEVQTIYGLPPRARFPESVTRCLGGISVVDASTVYVTDACTGLLVELTRTPAGP